jgi:hypothetical protein
VLKKGILISEQKGNKEKGIKKQNKRGKSKHEKEINLIFLHRHMMDAREDRTPYNARTRENHEAL